MRACRIYALLRADVAEVKLGISRNVPGRVAELQKAHGARLTLLGTWPGGRERERRVHNKWADLRLIGEWFRYTPELALWITEQIDERRVGRCGATECRSDCRLVDSPMGLDCSRIEELHRAAEVAA